jgi:hypothetical protein
VSTIRPVLTCLLACAMLASAIAAPAAMAGQTDYERYLASYGELPALDDGAAAAEAQEQYYSSYGSPATPDDTSDGVPLLPILVPAAAVALAAVVVGTARLRRRDRAGRPRARVAV